MRTSPTFLDRLNIRINEVDRAATAALSCAETLPPTGPASIIPSHLHTLRARVAALNADLRCLIALAHAGQMAPPAVMVAGQGRDGSEALSQVTGAQA